MEITDDARKMMENRVTRIMKSIDVPASDRDEIQKELISNYVDASMGKAEARGAASVEKSDMSAVLEIAEDPADIASAYMASYVSSLPRAGLPSRAVAFTIDMCFVTVLTWIVSIPLVLPMYLSSPPPQGPPPVMFLPVFILPIFFQSFNLLVVSNLAVIFAYFVICEGRFGYTPGKWLLGLKVLNTDGRKTDYKESMLRNIPKLTVLTVMADSVLMALYRRKDRQRLFDRIAGTIVISRNKRRRE